MINKKRVNNSLRATWIMAVALLLPLTAWSEQFSANFKGADIEEFINIVGKNLNKTIIIDPTVRGKINVRSYDTLNEEQYYQFFLNVLQVYGYAVVKGENNIIKVIKDKDAKTAAIRVADDGTPGIGDEMVTQVVPLYNTEAKLLAPLLRQLNDNAGGGNVVNYDQSNVLMLTGRASVVNKLVDIVHRVDKQGDIDTQVVVLKFASASEIVRIIENLYRTTSNQAQLPGQTPKVVADERLNAVVVSGDEKSRERVAALIKKLDEDQATTGNIKVRYLRYANAEDMVEVLTGFAQKLTDSKSAAKSGSKSSTSSQGRSDINIMAHADTNALVISADPEQMRTLESVIDQLDIRRAQVLVEAIIVEVSESDSVGFGVQMASATGMATQFDNIGPTISEIGAGVWDAQSTSSTTYYDASTGTYTYSGETQGDISTLASAVSEISGMAWGIWSDDFGALIQAVSSDTTSNVLATPSVTTLDNQEATFIVGDEVPVISGATASSDNSNPFQTVERKEVGVKLKVTPLVNEGSSVKLVIEQEVSGINGNTAVDVTFSTRRLTTTVMADSGEIVVLGGLINEDVQESVQKVPFLGDLPLIGWLFSSSSSSKTKKNLMVFIKPTIIREGMTMQGISGRKYNYFRALQLEQDDKGINLMPNSSVPVLPEWNMSDHISPEVNEVLERYKHGQGLDTKMRETDSTLKSITESKEKDKQEALEEANEAKIKAEQEAFEKEEAQSH